MNAIAKGWPVLILLGIVGVLVWATMGKGGGLDAIAHFPSVDTEQSFEERVLSADGLVVVDVYTEWCGYCKKLAPALADLAEDYRGRIEFVKLNAKANPAVSQRLEVPGYPTLVIFASGQEVGRVVGYRSKEDIRKVLDAALARGPSLTPSETHGTMEPQ